MSRFDLESSSALITGASAGIGREFARQLAGRARSLILVARRQERLEALRDELANTHPRLNVSIRRADMSDERAVNDLVDWLEDQKLSIDLLVNNAGLGDVGPFATSELQRVKEMLSVNMAALTVLTRLLLPGMIARKHGAILNVSSSASFLPMAGFAVYAATKAYVTSFSEAIRMELHGTGVTVTSLCPGPVHTEFTQVAHRSDGHPKKSGPEFTHVSVEDTVSAALNALTHDRALVIPGLVMKLAMGLVRLTPLPVLRLASRFSSKD
ncbi:MAG: SDR family oxidoreductase [Verrucomicrobiota bacterium]|nr:SDR family oxidoreductase [Verrucomicrobiota bacterium]